MMIDRISTALPAITIVLARMILTHGAALRSVLMACGVR